VTRIPPRPIKQVRHRGYFITLGRWIGRVVEVDKRGFRAVVVDQTAQLADETGYFPFEEISDDDRPLIIVGAVFYWAIGYRVDESRRRSRLSQIRFQRLPTWSQEELERIQERVVPLDISVDDAEPDDPSRLRRD